MKTKRAMLWSVIILLLLLLVMIARRKQSLLQVGSGPAEHDPAPTTNAASVISDAITGQHAHTPTSGTTAPLAISSPGNGVEPKDGLAGVNDVPIVFYGKLEDQFTNAVGNAAVKFGVRVYNGTRSGVDRGEVTSDANGLFTISGYKGESIDVVPEKSGYVATVQMGTGIYSHLWRSEQRAHPDPRTPIIIKMWKLQGAEPLIKVDQEFRPIYSKEPILLDLVSGRVVTEGGDLEIVLNRPEGEVSEHNLQKWSIRVGIPKGGLIEASDTDWASTFAAPDAGYERAKTFSNDEGPDMIYKMLFIQSRNGEIHAKIALTFMVNRKPEDRMYVKLFGFANANSSRNWEGAIGR